jgi:MscS family membrane protein
MTASLAPGTFAAALDAAKKPPESTPRDPLGRGTPYGTVFGFLRAAEKEEYATAAQYLETKPKPGAKTNEKLIRDLRHVLNRGLKIGLDDLSKAPEGNLDDGLPIYTERVGTVVVGEEKLEILLRRTTKPDASPVWLFAPETLLGVVAVADHIDLPWVEAIWPESFRQIHFMSRPLFALLNLLIAVPLLVLASWLLGRWLVSLLRPVVLRANREQGEHALSRVRALVILLIFAILLRAAATEGLTVTGRILLAAVATVLLIVAMSWLLVRITNLVTAWRIQRLQRAGRPSSIAAVELTGWLIASLFVIAGLFLILHSMGFEVTAAIAGLGVGGIAIAFAAQKTLENLFGAVTIVADKPIRVGDNFQAGTTEGIVESIGLRSTRIRTPDRALVTIPNGLLATMMVGNTSERDKFLFRHNVRLRYDSTAAQLRHVLAEVRKALLAHPLVEKESARTRLVRFSDYSMDLDVFAYVLRRDMPGFLEVQEELLLRIMDIVEASGTSIALPYQADARPAEQVEPQKGPRAHRPTA